MDDEASAVSRIVPSLVATMSRWSMKSNSTSNERRPWGIGDVVNPRELTYSGTCHQWFCFGERARRVFPTICSHM